MDCTSTRLTKGALGRRLYGLGFGEPEHDSRIRLRPVLEETTWFTKNDNP